MKYLEAISCSVCLKAGRQGFRRQQQYCSLFMTPRTGQHKMGIIMVGHRPPHVATICLPNVTAHDQIFQAFPLHICILQAIEYCRWEWPGNEARLNPE